MSNAERKDELKKEISSLREKLLDNTKAIDAETRQIILDTIREDKRQLEAIDSEERAASRIIVSVTDVPTGKTVVHNTNSNSKRTIIGDGKSMNSYVRMNIR